MAYYTRFSHFEGARHIAYSIEHVQHGFDDGVQELHLILDPTTTITGVRLGLEIFEARFLSIFGFSPIATQLLQIEATPNLLRLRLSGEGMKSRSAPPLKATTQWNAVASFLSELFGFNLPQDYQSKFA